MTYEGDQKKIREKLKHTAFLTQRGEMSGSEAERIMNREIDSYLETLDAWSLEERCEEINLLNRTKWRLLLQATSGKQSIRIPHKDQWIVFYLGEKELCSVTVSGSFAGEIQATKDLLASENGCKPEDITYKLEWR